MASLTKQGTYTVLVGCHNCGHGMVTQRNAQIPKGQTIENTPCPNCGCKALYRKSAH